MNEDFLDLLRALNGAHARFLIVGAHAMAAHGTPRATGDLDIWIEASAANAALVWHALAAFGAPVATLGVTKDDLAQPGNIVQLGVPPRRIDLLTAIDGVEFAAAWQRRFIATVAGQRTPFLSYEDLLCNKRSAARPKDLLDVELLERNREARAAKQESPRCRHEGSNPGPSHYK